MGFAFLALPIGLLSFHLLLLGVFTFWIFFSPNKANTEANGLAVGRASKFVGKVMETYISGCYTVKDEELFTSLGLAMESEGLFLEPSAHAGMFGPIQLMKNGQSYLEKHNLADKMEQATHLIWATGGSMVPQEMREEYLAKALQNGKDE